jgi:hypothetical protein
MYQVRKLHKGLITGLCLLLLVSCTWASVISVPELTFQSPGEVITGDIFLDSAPNGISGYKITLSIEDPEICDITGITSPEWAALEGTSPLPGSVVAIQGVDIGGVIETNSTGIPLARVSVTSKEAGSTSLLVTVNLMDDDAGNPVLVTIPPSHDETATSVPSGTTASATATMTQSGSGSGASYSAIYSGAGSGTSGSTPVSPEKTVSVTLFVPSQESMTPGNVTGPGSSTISQPSESSADTQVPSVAVSPTKAPFMLWVVLCALFCTGVIIRYKKSG